MLIGDMGMPAGGRFNGGHASHQTGLDVDIFLQLPQTRAGHRLQLLKPQALDLVASDGKHAVPSLWSPQISQLIKLAAEDSEVTRIFVNPAIKQQLCLDAGSDRQWLRKVRPWFQHRALCTSDCVARREVWSARIRRHRRPAIALRSGAARAGSEPPKPGSTPPVKKTPPPLPPSCQALLDEHVL